MDERERTSARRRTWAAAALIVVCGLAAYANSFTSPFGGLDDKQSIRDNPHIRRLWPPSEALSLPMWNDAGAGDSEDKRAAIARRPVLSLSFALTHRFSGLDPRGYHAVNLAIHLGAALLLFGIVRRTLARPRACGICAPRATWLALAATLIWLLHPLQTESVTFIIQRAEALSGLLVLLTLYCALRSFECGSRRGWEAAAIAACALGMGAKETAIVAPPLVVLYDRIFFSPSLVDCLRRRPVLFSGLALASLIPFALAGGGRGDFSPEATLSYALAQPRVILRYLRLALWPDELFVHVNTRTYDVRSAAQALGPGLAILGLAAATVWALARRPALGFAGAWVFLMLAPTSSVLAITDTIQEHRMYLALAAPAVLAVLAGDSALRAFGRRWGEGRATALGAGVAALLVLALGARTYDRNRDYHHEFSPIHPSDLYEAYTVLIDHYLSRPAVLSAEADDARALLASPNRDERGAVFAHFVLGFAHQRKDELEDAAREFELVVESEPEFAYAYRQLGVVLREKGDLDGAVAHLEHALRIAPRSVHAHKELAVALEERGDTDGARAELDEALRIKPNFSEAYYESGVMAAERGDLEQALADLRRAVRYRPSFAEAHYELAQALEDRGKAKRSVSHLARAVRFGPSLTFARVKLARELAERGDLRSARRYLRRAARLEPELAEAHYELGLVLVRLGRTERAAKHLHRAVRAFAQGGRGPARSPRAGDELASAHNALGMALAKHGRMRRAVRQFTRAVRLRPDFARAHAELGAALRARGEPASAVGHLETAIRLQPDSATAYKDLGIALRELNDLPGAAEQLERAVRLQPDYADAYNELGLVRLQQGFLRAAAEHFERAVAIRPDFAEAKARLARVQALFAGARDDQLP